MSHFTVKELGLKMGGGTDLLDLEISLSQMYVLSWNAYKRELNG